MRLAGVPIGTDLDSTSNEIKTNTSRPCTASDEGARSRADAQPTPASAGDHLDFDLPSRIGEATDDQCAGWAAAAEGLSADGNDGGRR